MLSALLKECAKENVDLTRGSNGRQTILSLLAAVSDAINLRMMDWVIGLASAGRACRMKQQYFYVEKNAMVQIITRIIAV